MRPDSPAFKALMLQIESDLLWLARWRTLLTEGDVRDEFDRERDGIDRAVVILARFRQ
jgi:hypothetical protein